MRGPLVIVVNNFLLFCLLPILFCVDVRTVLASRDYVVRNDPSTIAAATADTRLQHDVSERTGVLRWPLTRNLGRIRWEEVLSSEDYGSDFDNDYEVPQKGYRDCADYTETNATTTSSSTLGSLYPCQHDDQYYLYVPGNANSEQSMVPGVGDDLSSVEETGHSVMLTLYVALRPEQSSLGEVVTNLVSEYLNVTSPSIYIPRIDYDNNKQKYNHSDEWEQAEEEHEANNYGNPYLVKSSNNNIDKTKTWELKHLRTVSRVYEKKAWWWWRYDLLYGCFQRNSGLTPITNFTITRLIEEQMFELFDAGIETGDLYAYMMTTYYQKFGALDLTTNPAEIVSSDTDDRSESRGNLVVLTTYVALPPLEPCRRGFVTEFLSKFIQETKPELNIIWDSNLVREAANGRALPPTMEGQTMAIVDGHQRFLLEYQGSVTAAEKGYPLKLPGGSSGRYKSARLLRDGSNSWDMVHESTHSVDVVKTDQFWWWEYKIVYGCFWTESQKPITNTSLVSEITTDVTRIVQDGIVSGSLDDWLRVNYYGGAIGVLNITTDLQQVMVDSSNGDSSEDEEEDFIYKIPSNEIAEYSTPLDPNQWDWRRYTGLGIFLGTVLMTFVLMQAAVCRHREFEKEKCWGNLGTERGVEEVLGTGWKLNDNHMEIFDKTKLGYDEDQGSIFLGGFEQREAPTEITLTLMESATTSTPQKNHCPFTSGNAEAPKLNPQLKQQQQLPKELTKTKDRPGSEITSETYHCSFAHGTESELSATVVQSHQHLLHKGPDSIDCDSDFEEVDV